MVSRPWVLVVVLAFVVRLGLILATPDYTPVFDAADYDRVAFSLSGTGSFAPTQLAEPGGASAYRPPAYPVLLASAYEVSGSRWTAGRLAGVVLGTGTVALLMLLAQRLYDRRTALIAGVVCAVTPPLVWLSGALLSESLFLPLVLGMAVCVVLHRERPRWWWAAAAGALLGLAVLTRSNGLVLALPLVLGLRAWRPAAVALACTAVVLVPWTVRNAAEFSRILPLGTQSGYTMAGQWNAAATKGGLFDTFWLLPQTLPAFAGDFGKPGVDEGDLDAKLRSAAVRYASHHPGDVIAAGVTNLARTFDVGPGRSVYPYQELGVADRWVTPVRISLYLLAAAALVALALRVREHLWLWLLPLLALLATVPWIGSPRYATVLLPFAALAVARLRQVPV